MGYPITAIGSQPEQPGESLGGLARLGFGLGAIGASGFISYRGGRLWDPYLSGIRAVETGFPGAILRTFRVSEFLSPLESWNKLHVPQQIVASGGKYTDFLQSMFGAGVDDVTLQRTGSIFGEVSVGGRPVGMGLQIRAGTQKGSAIADYYARLTGVNLNIQGVEGALRTDSLNDALLRAEWSTSKTGLPYKEWLEVLAPQDRRKQLILGARYREKVRILGHDVALSTRMQRGVARAETTGKLLRAKAASTAGRLNTLLSKPLELPVVGEALSKIPIVRSMAVKPGSATQILGRYTKKALIAGAAFKGLEYYDYLRSAGSPWATVLGTGAGAAIGGLLFKKTSTRFSPLGLAAGAAAGLYTSLAPRFDEGLFYGAATIGADVNVARARMSEATGLTESLQEQERVSPGLISLKTALGFGGVGALGLGFYKYSRFLGASTKEKFATKLPWADVFESVRDRTKDALGDKFWGTRIGKGISGLPGGKLLSKARGPMALGFLGGVAAWGVASTAISLLSGNIGAAIPGVNLLGTTETPEELQAIYSGEKEVAIRKGRWWEFGRSTAYEGGRIEYYRPHALQRLKTRAYEKGLYGSEEERWEHDPLFSSLKALFGSDEWKYHYEQKYQYERPAPLTSTYGEDIPFIGPLIAATFGKLIKPRKLVRPEEWALGGEEYLHRPDVRGEQEPAYGLGGLGPGAPVSPEEGSQLFNELLYRRREAVGLIGFAEGAIQKAITGREEMYQNLQTLGTMGRETGSEYWLWSHLNIGGALGASEPVRRFIPHRRSYLETYNPLRNTMPSWLPDDYFLDLKYGNPFDKIKEAELRLPGPGYEALHPEVEGIDPERYPLAHRLKILGDVAMWSPEYKNTLAKAKRNIHLLSDQDKSIVRTTEEQVKSKKVRREFAEYRFDSDKLTSEQVMVTDVLSPRRIKTAEYGDMVVDLQGMGAVTNMQGAMQFAKENLEGRPVTLMTPSMESRKFDMLKSGGRLKAVAMLGDMDYGQAMAEEGLAATKDLSNEFEQIRFSGREKLAGQLSEQLLHGVETPVEMLTPMSPASKLIRQRSAIEEYVTSEAIGTGNAFWDRPIENFLRPAADMALYSLGFDRIPEPISQRRNINEYFDMLEWTKAERLENEARQEGRWQDIKEQQQAQQETLFGVDAFGSPTRIMKALPRRERDFYSSFVDAQSDEDRQQILELIPANERRIYLSQWLRQEEEVARARGEANIAQDFDAQVLSAGMAARKSEGFEISPELEAQWMEETNGDIPFDEWIRLKKAEEYFATHSLPGADWLGWHPSVDMDDVKLKYVEMAGLDHHDFDLWGARKRSLSRKPYINSELISHMADAESFDEVVKTRLNAKALAKIYSDGDSNVNIERLAANMEEGYDFEVKDGREDLVKQTYKYMGVG